MGRNNQYEAFRFRLSCCHGSGRCRALLRLLRPGLPRSWIRTPSLRIRSWPLRIRRSRILRTWIPWLRIRSWPLRIRSWIPWLLRWLLRQEVADAEPTATADAEADPYYGYYGLGYHGYGYHGLGYRAYGYGLGHYGYGHGLYGYYG